MKTLDYYLSLPYRMEIIPDMEEGGYTANFPELPGCLTCAETIEKLVENASDAKKVWLTAALEDGIEIAEPQQESALISYKGCVGSIEYSTVDGVYFGKIQDIPSLISYEGESLPDLVQDFIGAIDDYLVVQP